MMLWSALVLFSATASLILLDGGTTAAFSIPISNNACAFSHQYGDVSSRAFTKSTSTTTSSLEVSAHETASSPLVSEGKFEHLEELYNDQITREFEASQLYLSASIWCDQQELVGMGAYMRAEADEERSHGLSFIDFAMKRSLPLRLGPVSAPPFRWESPEELWSDVLNCEKRNSLSISNLADAAHSCHDHATAAFLQPFHLEQVDSMDKLSTILAKVKDENQTPGLLRQLDSELGGEAAL